MTETYTGAEIITYFSKLAKKRGYKHKIVGDIAFRSIYQGSYCTKNRMKFIGSKSGILHIITYKNNQILKNEKISISDIIKEIGVEK